MRSPLDGITILDLTIWQNGPWGTVMLSDMGANVIKIEDPVNGDPARGVIGTTPTPETVNAFFETMNRNKRSMTLDLRCQEGREVFYRMTGKADVITENFRVGVVERLGVDYETIRKINPRIIYASNSGFGDLGPDAGDGVYDVLAQARGGFMWMNSLGEREIEYRMNGGIADQIGAIILAYGIMAAVVARERFGIGQHIQTSLFQAQLTFQAMFLNRFLLNGSPPIFDGRKAAMNPLLNTYKCGDGKWVAMGCAQSDRYWTEFCTRLGAPDLIDDPRCANHVERMKNCVAIIERLDQLFLAKPSSEWVKILKGRGILIGPVQTYSDIPDDPQVVANQFITTLDSPTYGKMREVGPPVKMSETPPFARSPAPEFGQHTEEVLLEFGFTWEDIGELHQKKAI